MVNRVTIRLCIILILVLSAVGNLFGFGFTPGDFYASDDNAGITQYDSTGKIKGTLTLSLGYRDEIRGLAFGPNNLLYATISQDANFRVIAINASGAVQKTYAHTGLVWGNISYGKITFDNSGHFYVGTGSGLVKFDVGDSSSGSNIWGTDGIYDVEALPNSNLLLAASNHLYETTNTGLLVREIVLSDPNQLGGGSAYFTDIRGVEYDPASSSIFVTALGHANFDFQLMKLAGSSGVLLDHKYFWFGDDMFVTPDSKLIVGSRTQNPGMYTTNLGYLGTFEGGERRFVTQAAVPEPASILVLASGLSGLIAFRKRSRHH